MPDAAIQVPTPSHNFGQLLKMELGLKLFQYGSAKQDWISNQRDKIHSEKRQKFIELLYRNMASKKASPTLSHMGFSMKSRQATLCLNRISLAAACQYNILSQAFLQLYSATYSLHPKTFYLYLTLPSYVQLHLQNIPFSPSCIFHCQNVQ